MEVIPLGPGFGAELRGVTLADVAFSDAAYATVRAAFEEHSVLVLRGQEVGDELQFAFSRRFGPPEVTKVGSQGTGTHFVILSTIGPDGKVVPADHRMQMRNKANQLWHTDSSFKRVPALTSILSARIIPDHGGETEYVSTRLAFERLDASLQRQLENSFAWHDYAHSRGKIAQGLATEEERAAMLAHGMAQSQQRTRRALPRLPRLCCRRHGAGGRRQVDRGADDGSNGARMQLFAPMAPGRRRHVGQPRHHAPRATMAVARTAADDPHDHLRDGRRWPWHGAPAILAGGGIAALRPTRSAPGAVRNGG
jgi:alpha-ketoglutarate-dependent taurine dioxygenase